MSDPGRIIGRQILRCGTVTSTNDIARDLIQKQADEGMVITAAEQTSGRGSRGRTWVSPVAANLLLSVILRAPARVTDLAFVASLAAAQYAIDGFGLSAGVKWPNDVCVNGRKIAGILIECVSGSAILGIGINVNWQNLPADLLDAATSVAIETGRETDMETALRDFLSTLDSVYRSYLDQGFGSILAQWRPLDCLRGRDITVSIEGEDTRGTAQGVDDEGALILRLPDERITHVPSATLILY